MNPVLRFAEAARRLAFEARQADLEVPAFRAPTRVPGADRTVRRYPGGAVVSVTIKDRDPAAIIADMVDGVLALNGRADDLELRGRLLAVVQI